MQHVVGSPFAPSVLRSFIVALGLPTRGQGRTGVTENDDKRSAHEDEQELEEIERVLPVGEDLLRVAEILAFDCVWRGNVHVICRVVSNLYFRWGNIFEPDELEHR